MKQILFVVLTLWLSVIYTEAQETGYDWHEELHNDDLSDEHIQKLNI